MNNALFDVAESHETGAFVDLASGSAMFHRIVRELPVTSDLVAWGRRSDEGERAIASRIVQLLEEQIDLRYRHPHDIPVAIYLYALHQINREVSRISAHAVLETPNLCWAGRVAYGIQNDTQSVARTDSAVILTHAFCASGDVDPNDLLIQPFALEALRSRCRGSWSVEYAHDGVASGFEAGPAFVPAQRPPDAISMSLVA